MCSFSKCLVVGERILFPVCGSAFGLQSESQVELNRIVALLYTVKKHEQKNFYELQVSLCVGVYPLVSAPIRLRS
jgi:hypothetical protein